MAITLSVSSGRVDKGDTKKLTLTPKDENGDAFAPTTLTAVFTPPTGSATTKNLGDFTNNSNVYTVNHTFNVAGTWEIRATATDADSNTEVETGKILVHP